MRPSRACNRSVLVQLACSWRQESGPSPQKSTGLTRPTREDEDEDDDDDDDEDILPVARLDVWQCMLSIYGRYRAMAYWNKEKR